MRVAAFVNVVINYDGATYTTEYLSPVAVFLELSRHFEKVYLLAPLRFSRGKRLPVEVPLGPGNVEIVGLPHYRGAPELLRKLPLVVFGSLVTILRVLPKVDTVGAVVPSAIGNMLVALAWATRKKVFYFIRGNKLLSVEHHFSPGFNKTLVRAGVWVLDRFVRLTIRLGVPTFVVGEALRQYYGGDPRSVVVVWPAVPTDFDSVHTTELKSRTEHEGIRLLYVGRLAGEKGLDYLLEAVVRVRERHPVSLALVGDGPEEGRLRQRVAELGLGECVEFMGYIPVGDALVGQYRQSDIFVLSSLTEGIPLVVGEAMAMRLPVVATAVGGLPWIIRDGENGLLVPPADADALASAILRLIDDSSLRWRMGAEARRIAEEYRIDRQADLIAEALRSRYAAQPAEPVGASGK